MSNLTPAFTFFRAFLGTRMTRLQVAMREKDRGASAVELAFITAAILVVAGLVVFAITQFVNNEDGKITGTP